MLKIVLLLLWIVKIHALAHKITITSDSALIAYVPQTSWTRFFCGQTRRSHMETTDPDAYALITHRCESVNSSRLFEPHLTTSSSPHLQLPLTHATLSSEVECDRRRGEQCCR